MLVGKKVKKAAMLLNVVLTHVESLHQYEATNQQVTETIRQKQQQMYSKLVQ